MQWNLRMVAAQRDIWRCSDLRDALLAHGMDISTKKMLRLWSGQPISVRLDAIEAICKVLDCEPNDLMLPEPVVAAPKVPARRAGRNGGGGTPGRTKALSTGRSSRTFNGAAGVPRRSTRNRELDIAPVPTRRQSRAQQAD